MSDDSRSYVFPNTSKSGDVLQLANPAPLRGLTIVNQSTVTISVFKNGLAAPNSVPDFKVYPGTFQATPLPASSSVALRFDGSTSTSSGQAYAHFTTDLVAASSGSVPTSSPPASVPFMVQNSFAPPTSGSFTDFRGRTVFYVQAISVLATLNLGTVTVTDFEISAIPKYAQAGVFFSYPTGGFSPPGNGAVWYPFVTGSGKVQNSQAYPLVPLPGLNPSGVYPVTAQMEVLICLANADAIAQLTSPNVSFLVAGYFQ